MVFYISIKPTHHLKINSILFNSHLQILFQTFLQNRYKLFLSHGINLFKIILHRPAYYFQNTIFQIHASYYFSMFPHKSHQISKKIYLHLIYFHLTFTQYTQIHLHNLFHNTIFIVITKAMNLEMAIAKAMDYPYCHYLNFIYLLVRIFLLNLITKQLMVQLLCLYLKLFQNFIEKS